MTKMSKKYRNIAAGIAASLVILLGAGTAYAYNTPVAHISLDVNPAITYSVNAFNRVIHVDKNADAAAILQGIEWDGENINDVIEATILALKDADFLKNDKWFEEEILIGVDATSTDKEEQLILAIKEQLTKIVAKETGKEVDKAEVDLNETVVGIGADRVALTAVLNEGLDFVVTPGKVNLVQKLYASEFDNQESTSSEALEWITSTEGEFWLEGSVKDIMAKIKANRLELKGETVEGTDPVLNDEPKTKVNGNNGIGNDEGKVKVNDIAGEDENEMENERNENANANANQNGLSRGSIELEDN